MSATPAVPSEVLLVFVRAPRAGAVKTRLAAAIGNRRALAVYRALAEATMSAARRATATPARGLVVLVEPADAIEEVRRWLGPIGEFAGQAPGDLGAKLAGAFDAAFAAGAARVVAVGSDCPDVTPARIEAAFAALARADAVLGPARDGGYWAIGLARACPDVFAGIPWSTPRVAEATLARIERAGLRRELLPVLGDVDTLADYERWRARVARGER